jgi:hypothetical protein
MSAAGAGQRPKQEEIPPLRESPPAYLDRSEAIKGNDRNPGKGTIRPFSSETPPSSPVSAGNKSGPPEDLLEFIRKQSLPLATYLDQGEFRRVDENTLEWDFKENTFHLELLEGNGNKKKLEKICQDFFNRKIKIHFLGQTKEKVKRPGGPAQSRGLRPSMKETLNQPQIKDLIDIFQAEIIDIKGPGGA